VRSERCSIEEQSIEYCITVWVKILKVRVYAGMVCDI
jgi:hypothetical protein